MNSNYRINYRKLCYKNKDEVFVPICNFIPYVRQKKIYSNGKDTNVIYKVECQLLDKPYLQLKPLYVDTETFSNLNFIEGTTWEKYATVEYPQTQNKSRLKYVMQCIDKITMEEEMVYAHTGLKKIDGELCYLYQRRSNRKCK